MTTQTLAPVLSAQDANTPARPISPLTRLRIELRKLVDTRSSSGVLVATAALTVLMLVVAVATSEGKPLLTDLVSGAGIIPLATLFPVLGVLSTCGEWRHGTAMTTYALDPRRTQVLLAKVVAVLVAAVGLTLLLIAAGTLVAVVAGSPLPAGPAYARLVRDTVVALLALTLMGVGLGSAVLNTPLAIVVLLVVPQLVPQLLSLTEASAKLVPWVDVNALVYGILGGAWPTRLWPAVTTLALWIVVPLVVGAWRNAHKEA